MCTHHFPRASVSSVLTGIRNLTLLVVVQSAPSSVAIRNVIRSTWANKTSIPSLKKTSSKVVFLVGNCDLVTREMQNEIDTHNDIIAVDAEDSYKNLIFKTALTLHISQSLCPSRFLLKVDEDVVFNIERFMSGINRTFRGETPTIYCKTWRGSAPSRDRTNDWFVSEHQFRGRRYPDYCAGPSYVLTSSAVTSLLSTLPEFSLIPVEDVFITGIVAEKVRVRRIGMESRFKSDYAVINYTPKDCPGQLMSIHNLKTEQQIRNTWSYLSRNC